MFIAPRSCGNGGPSDLPTLPCSQLRLACSPSSILPLFPHRTDRELPSQPHGRFSTRPRERSRPLRCRSGQSVSLPQLHHFHRGFLEALTRIALVIQYKQTCNSTSSSSSARDRPPPPAAADHGERTTASVLLMLRLMDSSNGKKKLSQSNRRSVFIRQFVCRF
jgi:hypothetical protein